jgi:hypothetical protein
MRISSRLASGQMIIVKKSAFRARYRGRRRKKYSFDRVVPRIDQLLFLNSWRKPAASIVSARAKSKLVFESVSPVRTARDTTVEGNLIQIGQYDAK